MGRRTRTPNAALAALMREADWGNDQLARAVRRTGAEAGLRLTYDKTTVSHWLAGSRPRAEVAGVVREAFARRLGRPVAAEETGLGDREATDPVSGLVALGRADMDPSRRSVLAAGLYSAALAVPGFGEAAERIDRAAAGRTVRIGDGEVATVRTMTDRLAGILDELGAAHARPMMASFLVNSVGPWLQAAGSDRSKGGMLSAAADLTYLAGWSAVYELAQGLGQSYYVQALRLADQAGDHVTYCRTLRGMSLQASSLGHGPRALEYADSAAQAAPAAGPRLTAFLRGQQAHGAAMVKDRRQAFARLSETEAALSRADGRNDAVGGYDLAAYQFHLAHVLYELGDLPGSISALQTSNRVRPRAERQGRVHGLGLLARRQMEHGHVEAAAATWSSFLDDYTGISSVRGDEHFGALRSGLRPHLGNRAVAHLDQRARVVARLKAA
ncbi:hypothetical protein [Streptomyces sp. NRRL B-24484]|uniref:hypothetical protein n=1 Tax=Streptomyces sp. NRRL B-24484 TaxID=1463833 RepID=UPI0004BFD8B4|nr:hypothetical protein [Streptomyces sp. NRRL B-24484]